MKIILEAATRRRYRLKNFTSSGEQYVKGIEFFSKGRKLPKL